MTTLSGGSAGWAGLAAEFGWLLTEMLVLLVVVSALLGLLARRVGVARLHRLLGGSGLVGAGKGIALGFLTPFCTYTAIPVVVAMLRMRLGAATVVGFLLSSPLLDPVVAAILVLLFGWEVTLAYVGVTTVAVLAAALIAEALAPTHAPPIHTPPIHDPRLLPGPDGSQTLPTRGAGAESGDAALQKSRIVDGGVDGGLDGGLDGVVGGRDPFADDAPWAGWQRETAAALRYGAGVARTLALPVLLAVAGAVLILGTVPTEVVGALAGPGNPLAVPLAAVLGAPFYVATEAFLPIAAALHGAGMSLGASFALVISATGVNLPELAVLARVLPTRLLVAYAGAVVGVAVAAGYLVPFLT